MNITDAQLERFTAHLLELEDVRQAYRKEGNQDAFESLTDCLNGMLYAADFLCISVPVERNNGNLFSKLAVLKED